MSLLIQRNKERRVCEVARLHRALPASKVVLLLVGEVRLQKVLKEHRQNHLLEHKDKEVEEQVAKQLGMEHHLLKVRKVPPTDQPAAHLKTEASLGVSRTAVNRPAVNNLALRSSKILPSSKALRSEALLNSKILPRSPNSSQGSSRLHSKALVLNSKILPSSPNSSLDNSLPMVASNHLNSGRGPRRMEVITSSPSKAQAAAVALVAPVVGVALVVLAVAVALMDLAVGVAIKAHRPPKTEDGAGRVLLIHGDPLTARSGVVAGAVPVDGTAVGTHCLSPTIRQKVPTPLRCQLSPNLSLKSSPRHILEEDSACEIGTMMALSTVTTLLACPRAGALPTRNMAIGMSCHHTVRRTGMNLPT